MNKVIYWLVSVVILDLVITLAFWQYEMNPIVLEIGKFWFIITHLLVFLIPIFWKRVDKYEKIAIPFIVIVAIEYTLIFIGNLATVISV